MQTPVPDDVDREPPLANVYVEEGGVVTCSSSSDDDDNDEISNDFEEEEGGGGGVGGGRGFLSSGVGHGAAHIQSLYQGYFHDEEGFFRNKQLKGGFGEFYNPKDTWTLDNGASSGRMALDNVWPTLSLPKVATSGGSPTPSTVVVADREELAVVSRPSPSHLIPSPASRFILGPEGPGVIIPVAATVNRKELQDRTGTEGDILNELGVGPHQVYVGYVNKVPTGTALLAVPSGEDRDRILSSIPSARLAVVSEESVEESDEATRGDDDLCAFMRPGKSSTAPKAISTTSSGEGPPSSCAEEGERTSSVANTERLVNEAVNRAKGALYGGLISKVRLAATLGCHISELKAALLSTRILFVDVEHALALEHGFAVPVEIAIVELLPDADTLVPACVYHEIVNPGVVSDIETAMRISTCSIKGGHGIPLDAATFLNDDYPGMSERLLPFMDPTLTGRSSSSSSSAAALKRTILINKGPTTSDLHALRWVLCASNVVYGTSFDVSLEAALRIPMFDMTLIKDIMVEEENEMGTTTTTTTAAAAPTTWQDCCWYHRVLQDPDNHDELPLLMNTPHCALQDATKLAREFATFIIQ